MNRLDEKILDFLISRSDKNESLPIELRQDPDFNSQMYKELKQILDWEPEIFDYIQPDPGEAWEKIILFTSKPSSEMKSNSVWKWIGIAASVLVVLGAAAYFVWFRSPFMYYESENNDMVVILPDSSRVALQPYSKLTSLRPKQYLMEESKEVTLEGEAVFTVLPGEVPLKVLTEHTSVEVMPAVMCMSVNGDLIRTIFRVKAIDEYSEAENIEGVIRFAVLDSPEIEVILNSGDKATYAAGDESIHFIPVYVPQPPPPPTNYISIRDLVDILTEKYPERLEFSPYMNISAVVIEVNMNLDLSDLIAELSHDPNIQITYNSKGVGNYVITGLSGVDLGLEADYNWNDFESGKPFRQPEDYE